MSEGDPFRRLARGLFAAAVALASAAAAAGAESSEVPPVRPIAGAERAAVGFALDYLAAGPKAWIPALSASSRFSKLPPSQVEAELEARAGPPLGATWELETVEADAKDRVVFSISYPSGFETTLRLDLVSEGTVWKIQDVRILEEPTPSPDLAALETAPQVPPPATPGRLWRLVPFLAAAVLAVAGILASRKRRGLAIGLIASSGATVLAGVALVLLYRPAPERAAPSAEEKAAAAERLGGLRQARQTQATADSETIRKALASLPVAGYGGQVSRLWRAQSALRDHDLKHAADVLKAFPADGRIAQVEILRARLAFLQNRPADMARSYQAAIVLSPGNDGLLFEAAQLCELMADSTHGDGFTLEAAHHGSRVPDVSYAQAAYWIGWDKGLDAERWFRRAWELRPVERASLFQQVVFWDLLRRPQLYASLRLDSPEEPTVQPTSLSVNPIVLPAGAEARVCGEFLRVRIRQSGLNVPGGASLAPAGTPVDDAGAWTRAEEREATADLPKLLVLASSPDGVLQPLVRRQTETAAFGLARHRRWDDVVRLTDGIANAVDRAPSNLLVLRAEALRRLGRVEAAKDFALQIAGSELLMRRATPGQLFDLAEILSSLGEHEQAVKIAQKGASKLRIPIAEPLIWRLKMEKRLAASYVTYSSEHFTIRYPKEQPEAGTKKLAVVLEGERERLRRWVPLQSNAKIEVQLLWFEEFEKAFSDGIEIVGLYDGKIRLPFAGGASLDFSHPAIVAVVTHELAHAMVAEATHDAAPRWFQEGLAQHVEMTREHFNPVPLYERRSQYLSLSVVEGMLEGLPAPDLALASYEEARWMFHYLEATSGVKSIHRLLEAFREGADSEEALTKISYKSISDFDERFRRWCRLPESVSWNAPMLRYLGNRASAGDLPASLQYSPHRVRWQQSEEPFPPNEEAAAPRPQGSSRR